MRGLFSGFSRNSKGDCRVCQVARGRLPRGSRLCAERPAALCPVGTRQRLPRGTWTFARYQLWQQVNKVEVGRLRGIRMDDCPLNLDQAAPAEGGLGAARAPRVAPPSSPLHLLLLETRRYLLINGRENPRAMSTHSRISR